MSIRRIISIALAALISFALYSVARGDVDLGFLDAGKTKTQSAQVSQIPGSHNIKGLDRSDDPDDCELVKGVVQVQISASEYPESADHIRDVNASGDYPKIWHLDRAGADENRDESLAGIPTESGKDRDELPPASSYEGGDGADVRLIDSSDNRGSGSSLGSQMSDYCSGQAFQMVTTR